MGGEISLKSTLGVGTTFTFTIPLVRPNIITYWKPPNTLEGKSLRSAVVSDREIEAETIQRYLSDYGIQSERFQSCEELIAHINNSEEPPFDFVLINPTNRCEKDCFIVHEKRKRNLFRRIKFIVLSHDTKVIPSHLLGLDGFLRHPIKKDHLFFIISEVLSREHDHSMTPTESLEPKIGVGRFFDIRPLRDYRLLLVEDNPINQKVALLQLKELGYQAEIANNGEEALKKTQSTTYDLILMDCQMPVMDGFEATRQIRIKETLTGKHIPIIAMTANALEGDKEKCIASGMDDYISKPVDIAVLKEKLQRWLK